MYYEGYQKVFIGLDNDNYSIKDIVNTGIKRENGRFSILDDTAAKALQVNISNVCKTDSGVYFCGTWNDGEIVNYYSLFTEIQLQVSGKNFLFKPFSDKTAAKVNQMFDYYMHKLLKNIYIFLKIRFIKHRCQHRGQHQRYR